MSSIRKDVAAQPLQPLSAVRGTAQVAGPAATRAIAPADQALTGLELLHRQLVSRFRQVQAAVLSGDTAGASRLAAGLVPLAEAGVKASAGTPYAATFAQIQLASQQINAQLAAVPAAAPAPTPDPTPAPTQKMLVGLPGRGGRVVEVAEAPKSEHKGPFGFLGKALGAVGGALETVAHGVFAPLEFAGKLLEPVTKGVGSVLDGARQAIDNSVGRIPVIGQAVRFTTGLANSVVGMVGGAVQGITHPVELVKGLGSMLWTASAFVPPFLNARTLYDAAVNGKSPLESFEGARSEGGAILKGFFHNAIENVKAGNWSGALGQVVGDVGSFFVSGGAAGAGKVASTGAKVAELSMAARAVKVVQASKVGKLARVAKVDALVGAGAKVLGAANNVSAAIFTMGLKGNFSVLNRVRKAASGLPGMQRVTTLGTQLAERVRGAVTAKKAVAAEAHTAPMATGARPMNDLAAAATKPKAAASFAPELLAGEVRYAGRELPAYLAEQPDLLKTLGKQVEFDAAISDQVLNHMLDHTEGYLDAFKGKKVSQGSYKVSVSSLEDAAAYWDKLPANSPERVAIAKQLAEATQKTWSEALHFPAAPVEFSLLPESLAGLAKDGKVFVDPAMLNEPLSYLMNVMAEEQTHAFQKFLVAHKGALPLPPRVAKAVDRYSEFLTTDRYMMPPSGTANRLSDQIAGIDKATHEALAASRAVERLTGGTVKAELAALFPKGSAEAAACDNWFKAQPALDRPFGASEFEALGKAVRREAGTSGPGMTTLNQYWTGKDLILRPNVHFDYRTLKNQLLESTTVGSPERALVDAWWQKAHGAAEDLGYLKYVEAELAVPGALVERGNPRMPANLAEARTRIQAATKELEAANKGLLDEVKDWTRRYQEQSIESHAKTVAETFGHQFNP